MPYMIISFIATIFIFFGLTWWSVIFMFIILTLLTTHLGEVKRNLKRKARRARRRQS